MANHEDLGTLLAQTDTQTRKYFTCIWPSFGIQGMKSDNPVSNWTTEYLLFVSSIRFHDLLLKYNASFYFVIVMHSSLFTTMYEISSRVPTL